MQTIDLDCQYSIDSVYETSKRTDLAIVASGSATLQVAAAGCPMVVMYQSNRILWYLIGRWIINTKFLSLVNILAGRELVVEFMPYFSDIAGIVQVCDTMLDDTDVLFYQNKNLLALVEPMTKTIASEKVAQIAAKMVC